jgi:NADPH:quinone reductase-like Zn-dependent oxidoreductase
MIPGSMTAVQVQSDGRLAAGRIPVPVPAPGEVLVRIAASPINPSDLKFLAGAAGSPAVPGLEGSGRVVAAGAGLVPRLLTGRRVAFASARGGAWAEYATTTAMGCIPLGRRVSTEQAAMLIVNPLTALAFLDMARSGRHAAIVNNAAASALGRLIIHLGRRHSLPVINIVRRKEHVTELRQLGADYVLDSSDPSFAPALRDLAGRLRATLVFDAIGGSHTRTLVEEAPPASTIVAYGNLAGEPSTFDPLALVGGRKTVVGFYLGHWAAQKGLLRTLRDVVRVQRLIGAGLETEVRNRVTLEAAPAAVEAYRQEMSGGKILIVADASQSG